MNFADAQQMYDGTLLLYKGQPHKVLSINRDVQFVLLNLETQKKSIVDFEEKHFRPFTKRLGMVNCNDGVAYVSRIPVRKYWNGLSAGNISIKQLVGDRHSNFNAVRADVQSLQSASLGECLSNHYPSFSEALKWVKSFYGAYAFDKQFAVGTDGYVWYKTEHVGNWDETTKTIQDIVWLPGKDHLLMLLDGSWKNQIFKDAS